MASARGPEHQRPIGRGGRGSSGVRASSTAQTGFRRLASPPVPAAPHRLARPCAPAVGCLVGQRTQVPRDRVPRPIRLRRRASIAAAEATPVGDHDHDPLAYGEAESRWSRRRLASSASWASSTTRTAPSPDDASRSSSATLTNSRWCLSAVPLRSRAVQRPSISRRYHRPGRPARPGNAGTDPRVPLRRGVGQAPSIAAAVPTLPADLAPRPAGRASAATWSCRCRLVRHEQRPPWPAVATAISRQCG